MKVKKSLVWLIGGLSFFSFLYVAGDRKTKTEDFQTYQSSESAVRLLKGGKAFRLYKSIRKKDPLIFPAAFAVASEDLKHYRKKRGNSGFLISLTRIRHLIGDSFPSDFAIDLAEMEHDFIEKAHTTRFPVQEITDDQRNLARTVTPAAFLAYFPPDRVKDDRFKVLASASGENGFSATAFKDADGNVVIAFRGSNDTKDLADTRRIASGMLPKQYENAQNFYNKIRQEHPDAPIRATGHSFGGSLAQLLAAKNPDVLSFPCNPVGTKHLLTENDSEDNIFNLIVESDPFSFALPQAGHSFLIRSTKKNPSGDPLHPHSVFYCFEP